MADPLRRTLLSKLRGKKPKKGATRGAGLGSGGHEGKAKVSRTRRDCDEPRPGVALELQPARMSTYDNCGGGGATARSGGVQESCAAELLERASGVNKELPGVSLQRAANFVENVPGGDVRDEQMGRKYNDAVLAVGPQRVPRRPWVSVPRQCRVGDAIGFGDSPNFVPQRAQKHSGLQHRGAVSEGGEQAVWGHPRHMVGQEPQQSSDSGSTSERSLPNPNFIHVGGGIQTVESASKLQTPTFFPTHLQICDREVGPTERRHRFHLDSEDDDYYDNEILPFYETARPKRTDSVEPGQSGQQTVVTDSAQETDRLRNQLQEAYYLLINAMNDINLDVQQATHGPAEQQAGSSCSSRSRDSLCSRLSAKNMDSDSWSSGGDHSPQQVSDSDSLLLCLAGNLESKAKLESKSVTDLSVTDRPVMSRSVSDSAIKYRSGPSIRKLESGLLGVNVSDKEGQTEENVQEADERSGPSAICRSNSSEELLQDDRREELNESSGSVNSLTGSSDSNSEAATHPGQRDKLDSNGVRPMVSNTTKKAHGVTVNKMQEWMHKGRLLSSEMKQRIQGPALPCQDRWSPHLVHCKAALQASGRGVKCVKAKSRPHQQPAFIEHVHAPCVNGREATRSAGEPLPWRPQHTSIITVSKKRNWLQQSYHAKNPCTREDALGMLGVGEEGGGGGPSSSSPDHLRTSAGPSARPARLHVAQVTVGQSKAPPHLRSVDPAEENDADDEGEIWYNPIPEDDEPEASRRPSVRLLVTAPSEALQRRPSRAGEAGQGGRTPEGLCGTGPEAQAEGPGPGSGSGDVSQGNAAHSTQALHLHRQMLACKPQDSASRQADCLDLPVVAGFSPPSSPNPTKKSSSINWSFPDKIKSPRTVRKISMKMKKLPELSRKLSVKGTHSSNNGNNLSEPRALSPRANASGAEAFGRTAGPSGLGPSGAGQASCNVISRYHLDSSVSTQNSFSKKKNNGSSKSASKGGYLSDGDSPELVAKSGKHGSAEGKGGRCKETDTGGGSSRLNGTDLDIDAFRHYSFTEQPRCTQYISGLMSLHFYGAEDLKPPRIDSRDVYCAIQVDSVNKARTALLTCRTTFLDMDHTFNIELENAQHLKLVVFSWEPTPRRNRVCCHGTVVLPGLFRVTRFHQLAVKLEPRGLIYVKLSLIEQWQNSLDGGPDSDREPQVFGVEAWRVVERENTGLMVPLIIDRCINEIERRGCQVVGLYRLCGSAAVKKELREAFERDSYAVELSENVYPDINVITGVLKDYLRELPFPLINKPLYEAVLDAMLSRPLRMGAAGCENDQADSERTVSLLEHLPEVERVTLRKLLDHLKRVASHQDVNKMTCQNLAVCFGPVLLSQRQEASCHTNRVFIDSEELASALHFKKHIEVLHYLLQLWPVVDAREQSSSHPPAVSAAPARSDLLSVPPLRRRKERPQVLNLSEAEMAGVLRPKPGRLDSPSNRYAGDWSGCGESYFPTESALPLSREEADYDDVPSEDTGAAEEIRDDREDELEEDREVSEPTHQEESQRDEVLGDEKEEEFKEEAEETEAEEDGSLPGERLTEERLCDHILPPPLPKEHSYQAYMKIQDISPVLSNRVNLRDLQESIDALIGNLERELNKNKLNVGY